MARARGSYPRCHWFKSSCRYHYKKRTGVRFHIKRPGGQAVKTPPFHGGNTGSSPVRVTTFFSRFQYGGIAQPVERSPHTREVTDSSSVVSTKNPLEPQGFRGFNFFNIFAIDRNVLVTQKLVDFPPQTACPAASCWPTASTGSSSRCCPAALPWW